MVQDWSWFSSKRSPENGKPIIQDQSWIMVQNWCWFSSKRRTDLNLSAFTWKSKINLEPFLNHYLYNFYLKTKINLWTICKAFTWKPNQSWTIIGFTIFCKVFTWKPIILYSIAESKLFLYVCLKLEIFCWWQAMEVDVLFCLTRKIIESIIKCFETTLKCF